MYQDGFNRFNLVISESTQLQPSLQCGNHRQGQNHLFTGHSLLEDYLQEQPVSFWEDSMKLSTKIKWNQQEQSNNFCNNEWFGYCFIIFPQHILKMHMGIYL